MLCYHNRFHALQFFRIDYIKEIEILEEETDFSVYNNYSEKYRSHLWGTSDGGGYRIDHLEMTIHVGDKEDFIPKRLEREKRCGSVTQVDENTWRYTAEVFDTTEMLPWIRTFISRITRMNFSNRTAENQFKNDLQVMYRLYGLDGGEDE